ncbi:hypothetical protein MRB53_029854 [Persea americana]|uniref:Uncharacterized protein n=1 Tax=Persea americana TaxID=3435 RepID=A0ACC2KJZ5_PERAE|nr:hypothetical protein MRB53_029854 [Persea americana]
MVMAGVARVLIFFFSLAVVAHAGPTFEEENSIRWVTDGLLDLQSTILQSVGDARHALTFARFARRYGKTYGSVEEIKHRFHIFVDNLELIYSTYRKGLPYKLGINKFADMSWEEFRVHSLGAAQNCSATKGTHKLTDDDLPEAKDWREDGIVSPVKNQGHCGSCWTFSSTGALEAAYTKVTGKSISLSEEQLVDCATAFNNFGCSGGLPSQAFEYIKYNGGLDTEESYPYTGVEGSCSHITLVVGFGVRTEGAEDKLKHAVGVIGPVSVAFEVVDGFRFYKGGVYTSTACGNTEMDINHAVLAVGYGVENGVPYWIIKNSWGKNWGDHGYFKMELGKNMCGIATCASYPIIAGLLPTL